jgi:hypothetical protein
MAATAADIAGIDAVLQMQGTTPPTCPVCVLQQLPAAGSACSNAQASGWCYVLGSCAGDGGMACQQDICTTLAYSNEQVVASYGAWLACP